MENRIELHIALPGSPDVHVTRAHGVEEMNRPFEFHIHVVCTDPAGLDEQTVLTNPASIRFERNGELEREMFGMISVIEDQMLTESTHRGYELTFVPRAWQMGLSKGSAVYVDKTVPEILTTKLTSVGLEPTDDFELRLLATYPQRELVIQYGELDLSFCCRIAEHAGISLFFEHRNGRDVLVLSDDNVGFLPAPGQERSPSRLRGEARGVYAIKATTRALPGQCVVRDYNYRTPSVAIAKSSAVADGGKGTVYEYGDQLATPDEAERVALIRAQEIAAGRRVFEGECDLPRLAAGARSVLEGHVRADGELLIVRAEHHIEQAVLGAGQGAQHGYSLRFRAIPAATPYRPPRTTPKPRVLGAINGIVEAAKEGGKYAELDDSGRYHVRFMFDPSDAPKGAASSLLRMAQPSAGAGAGFHFPLRDGTEVIVTCIDGDPDRPVIAGAVPNPQTPSPVDSKNAARNVIKTGGGSEINIDDTEGSSRVKISVPHGNTFLQLGAPNDPTAGFSVGSANDAKIAGTNISLDATNVVKLSALTVIAETGQAVQLQSGGSVEASAPSVSLHGSATTTVSGGGLLMATAPLLLASATTVLSVNGPVVIIGGGVVTVVGGTVNIDGAQVNIKGSPINLNPE